MTGFDVIEAASVPIKAWARGVPIEDAALQQLRNVASLPFVLFEMIEQHEAGEQ